MKQGPDDIKDKTSLPIAIAEVSIWLDSYDDIFSDFDPNPYATRALSDDFITQAIKFSKDKNGKKMALNLLLPAAMRNEQSEKIVIKRLHAYFKESYQQLKQEISKTTNKGLVFIFVGIILMVVASYLSFLKEQKYFMHVLLVLVEPAGWFLFWSGLDHIVYQSKTTKKEFEFYSKMAKADIKFLTY